MLFDFPRDFWPSDLGFGQDGFRKITIFKRKDRNSRVVRGQVLYLKLQIPVCSQHSSLQSCTHWFQKNSRAYLIRSELKKASRCVGQFLFSWRSRLKNPDVFPILGDGDALFLGFDAVQQEIFQVNLLLEKMNDYTSIVAQIVRSIINGGKHLPRHI